MYSKKLTPGTQLQATLLAFGLSSCLKYPVARTQLPKEKPIYGTQAERVIARFGGISQLHKALQAIGVKLDKSTIWSWKNHDGMIAKKRVMQVIEAGHYAGVILTSEDLDPRPTIDPKDLFENHQEDSPEYADVTVVGGNKSRLSKDALPSLEQVLGSELHDLKDEIKQTKIEKPEDE